VVSKFPTQRLRSIKQKLTIGKEDFLDEVEQNSKRNLVTEIEITKQKELLHGLK